MAESDIGKIVWPEPQLKDLEAWNHNLEVVRWLCEEYPVIQWLAGEEGRSGYVKFPYEYNVNGTVVRFLPHWGFLQAGRSQLRIPRTREEISTMWDFAL